ncbi:MAG: hypothetical protein ACYTBJ_08215 [Planctomycetota bacterium]
MIKRVTVFAFLLLTSAAAFGAKRPDEMGLRDGLVFAGISGRLVAVDVNEGAQAPGDRWFFEFGSDLTDGAGRVAAGSKLEVLPSAALERMIAESRKASGTGCRIRGRITRYRDRNFIFVAGFAPVIKSDEPSPSKESPDEGKPKGEPAAEETEQKATIGESNDVIALPPEMVERLKKQKPVRRAVLPERTESVKETRRLDSILVDRTGLVESKEADSLPVWERVGFVLDGWGRKAGQEGLGLLPCEELERAQRQLQRGLDPVRFKTAGILTRYKGRDYLLVQKATRIYSYGNFGR